MVGIDVSVLCPPQVSGVRLVLQEVARPRVLLDGDAFHLDTFCCRLLFDCSGQWVPYSSKMVEEYKNPLAQVLLNG